MMKKNFALDDEMLSNVTGGASDGCKIDEKLVLELKDSLQRIYELCVSSGNGGSFNKEEFIYQLNNMSKELSINPIILKQIYCQLFGKWPLDE